MAESVGLLGGGVIGGGWAARFLLAGTDVRLYDPDPEAERKIGEMLENARRALARLSAVPLPRAGSLMFVATPAAAAEGVRLVQESAPERLELKQALLAEVCAAAAPDVLIASSTSGLRPTALAARMARPERFLVAHPFNPVYLLPLVELCAGERTSPEAITRAGALYGSLGMAPLVVRKEIDGFVADRMLEALWREALWLVNDGVATVAEVDDAIRLGAGLRWSFMGTFLTYRIAGGEDGMRHFMAQFGPALQWPWTKLTDVPELTPELIDTIVAQSDEQAGGRSVRELEQLRDDCLVSVLQALRARDIGAGTVLARYERASSESARQRVAADDDDLSRPLALHRAQVVPEWVDYNGHAHESRYLQVFGDASDALFAYVGIDAEYLARGSYFTVETHLSTCARRSSTTGSRSRPRCSTAMPAGCTSSTRSRARATARSSRPPSSSTCTWTPSPGARRRRLRPCLLACSASPARMPRCRAPSGPVARSASRSLTGSLLRAGVEAREPAGRDPGLAASALHVAVGACRHDHDVDVPCPAGARRTHPAAGADVLRPLPVRAAVGDLDRDHVRAAIARAPARVAVEVVRRDHLTAAHAVERLQRLERGGTGLGGEDRECEHQTDDERGTGHGGFPRNADRGSRRGDVAAPSFTFLVQDPAPVGP